MIGKALKFNKNDVGLVVTFCLAALVLTWLSYVLPRFLPGDFVTAAYSTSQVTLTAEQETELRDYYGQHEGFGHYLSRVIRFDWGYSYVFETPVSALFFSALPWTILLVGSAHVISMLMAIYHKNLLTFFPFLSCSSSSAKSFFFFASCFN